MDNAIEINDLWFSYPDGPPVLKHVSCTLKQGDIVGIFGPNGAGKSTFLKTIAGLIHPKGSVRVMGKEIHKMSRYEASKLAAYVPPVLYSPFPYTVFDFVAMAKSNLPGWTKPDRSLRNEVMDVLSRVDMQAFADRPVTSLSSGEQKLVLIARAIIQGSGVLLMDEPLANLDMGHAIRVMQTLARLRHDRGLTVLCVSHDVNIPLQFADTVILLNRKLIALGKPDEVMLYPLLKDTFRTEIYIGRNELTGALFMVPIGEK